jgi:hypothetical protein
MIKPPKTWEILESLAESGHISFIDISLAKELLGYK